MSPENDKLTWSDDATPHRPPKEISLADIEGSGYFNWLFTVYELKDQRVVMQATSPRPNSAESAKPAEPRKVRMLVTPLVFGKDLAEAFQKTVEQIIKVDITGEERENLQLPKELMRRREVKK